MSQLVVIVLNMPKAMHHMCAHVVPTNQGDSCDHTMCSYRVVLPCVCSYRVVLPCVCSYRVVFTMWYQLQVAAKLLPKCCNSNCEAGHEQVCADACL